METIILLYPSDGVYNEVMDPILPLGLLSIAAPLVKEGYDVKIIDQRIDKDWKNTLITFLKRDPIFVAMTTMTGSQINFALEASKIVKENSFTHLGFTWLFIFFNLFLYLHHSFIILFPHCPFKPIAQFPYGTQKLRN